MKPRRPLSRKKRRQLERAAKKEARTAHPLKKQAPKPALPPPRSVSSAQPRRQKKRLGNDKRRTSSLLAANQQEAKEISKLEKLLKMKKRKCLPASFRDDGLDYLLDLTDVKHSTGGPKTSPDNPPTVGVEEEEEGEGDESWEEEEEGMENGEEEGMENGEEGEGEESGEEEEEEGVESTDGIVTMEYQEPRLAVAAGRYVPPQLRGSGRADREKLQKKVQGLINRLSEANMHSITHQLEHLYTLHSRNDMNCVLSEVLLRACVSPTLISERFALEAAMLVALLHAHVATEVGAHVVQVLAKRLAALMAAGGSYGAGRECDCVLLLLAQLYNLRVIHCLLIYDVIRLLVESFSERDVELLLLLLKNCGMQIRKDDAMSLKTIVLQIQSKAASSSPPSCGSRMRFMLDTITAIRHNNVHKIPGYDPSLLEHGRRLLRGLIRGSSSSSSRQSDDEGQLKISLKDLLSADTSGRWWVVGSSWSGRDTGTSTAGESSVTAESWVLELARRQQMNTDVRKNIFCVLMTSEDYADAFEQLLKLGLKDVQEREMVHVLLTCCLQEKAFNPYYAFLAQRLCDFKRSHQVTFQYAIWDRLKMLQSLTTVSRSNLAALTAHLVANKSLSLAVLRVVEFGALDEEGVKFYRRLLHTLLCGATEDSCRSVFARIAPLPNLKALRSELNVFMKHFLLRRSGSDKDDLLINKRITLAEHAMRTES